MSIRTNQSPIAETNVQGLRWTVSYEGLDPDINNVYYFRINGDYNFISHYFNITGVENTSTSSTLSVSPSTMSTSTISSSASTTKDGYPSWTRSASWTWSPDSDNYGDSGGSTISAGAIAGIAVGGTLGTIVIVAISGILIWKRLKNKRNERFGPGGYNNDLGAAYYAAHPSLVNPLDDTQANQTQELSGVPLSEMDGGQAVHKPHEISS